MATATSTELSRQDCHDIQQSLERRRHIENLVHRSKVGLPGYRSLHPAEAHRFADRVRWIETDLKRELNREEILYLSELVDCDIH